jgi:hypothetical protein
MMQADGGPQRLCVSSSDSGLNQFSRLFGKKLKLETRMKEEQDA